MLTNPSPKSTLKRYPAGSIFQSFGENIPDYAPIGYPKGHPGWDILAYEGAPLVACTDGNIYTIKTDPKSLGGLVIWLSDGTYIYGYGHLKEILVKPGQRVKAGDKIGTMGNTGFIISGNTKFFGDAPAGKGVHCHFGITPIGKEPIDPTPFFTESIKPEIPSQNALLAKIIELLRSLIRSGGGEPIV